MFFLHFSSCHADKINKIEKIYNIMNFIDNLNSSELLVDHHLQLKGSQCLILCQWCKEIKLAHHKHETTATIIIQLVLEIHQEIEWWCNHLQTIVEGTRVGMVNHNDIRFI